MKKGRMIEESESEKKQKALKISVKEGAASSFSTGVINNYIIPFAKDLQANVFQIGLLSAFSGLLAPLAQLYGSNLMEKYHRKKLVAMFVLLQAITWIPLAILAWLYFQGNYAYSAVYILLAIYSILAIFIGAAYPAWFSWMGDLVKENERGKYFAKRNIALGIIEISAVLIGLVIINAFDSVGYKMIGFAVLFILAFIFRFVSFAYLLKQYSPKLRHRKSYHISLKELLKKYPNFRRFGLYQLLFNFAIMIASPFFAFYMLKELNFTTSMYIAVTISQSIFIMLFYPLAGKLSDRFGDRKLIYIANIAFILSPLSWLFIRNPLALIFIPQLIAGIANAAYIISFTNFTYGAVKPRHVGKGIAYLNVLVGIGTFVGSIVGGILIQNIHLNIINSYFVAFIITALLRFLVAVFFLPKIKEEKKVESLPPIHINITHPFKTIHAEIGWFKQVFK